MKLDRSVFLTLLPLVAFAGCSRQSEKTIIQYMPHMANTPILKAQKGYDGFGNGASVLMPPEHTVAIGHRPYHIETPEQADKELKNPLPMNQATNNTATIDTTAPPAESAVRACFQCSCRRRTTPSAPATARPSDAAAKTTTTPAIASALPAK